MPAAKRRKKSATAHTSQALTSTPRTSVRLREKAEKAATAAASNPSHEDDTTPSFATSTSDPSTTPTAMRATKTTKVQSSAPPSPAVESSPETTPPRSSNMRVHKLGNTVTRSPSPTPPPPTPSSLWQNDDCLREVCSYLGQGDLHALLTVNRAFYLASTPLLYRLLRQPPGCPCHGLPERDVELAEQYTTALEFFPHSHRRHLPRFKSSRITTHIVNYDFANKKKETDKHGRTPAWGTYKCPNCPKMPPPPQRIVFRPMYTAADYKYNDKTPKRILIPSGTKCTNRIVHISLHMFNTSFSYRDNVYASPPLITPTKQLTVVILPQFWDCGHVIVSSTHRLFFRSLRYALRDLVFLSHDHTLRIVGLEVCDPFAGEDEWNDREARKTRNHSEFKTTLDHFMASWHCFGWSSVDKARVHDKITYQTFRDYLESGDWGEELPWQLVGRWLNALDRRENGLMTTPVLPDTERVKAKADKDSKQKKKKNNAKRKRRAKYDPDTESEAEFTSDGEGDWVDRGRGKKKVKVKKEVGVIEDETDEEDY